ncbi:unnamed protein product [Larinioides sclopetarius]|uniref:Fatty acid synthase n=1 Tax=Larinioides sclopetarius TaxID=280406 RepID=A0AAV2BL63_9ARAC
MGTELVISGISGRFPECDNIAEFSQKLFNKVDLLTEDSRRWEPGLYGTPRKMGKLKDISKFDSQFFGIHYKQAEVLDPQARILLELTHECIVDAGYNPEELRGKNVGVFIGNSSSESDDYFSRDLKNVNGYAMIGCCRAMFANLVSFTFDFKGPSFTMDTACSSGLMALYEAVRAIQNDECEAAIVGAANLCLKPESSLHFHKLNALSDDGVCKAFDAACNGYARSEAIVTLLVQKSDVVRRKYASIVHIKTNTDGFKEKGVTYPSTPMQKRLMKEVYDECKLNPLKVSFVEAHGTGTIAGDPAEMTAIAEIFCPGREEPLLVGSSKSNMGHSEAASGLCSIAKIIIAMENSLIPPNLHFYQPNPNIKALVDGQVRIVINPTPWEGDYVAVNSFGFGGVNVHAVLKSNRSERKPRQIKDMHFPQLALYSGRTEEAVQYLFDYLQNEVPPSEFFALLHKSVYSSNVGKPFRGYKLHVKDQEVSEIKKLTSENRPVWYIFSGMGTQWPGMAKQLMELEIFARSMRISAEILKPYGLDLIDIVTNGAKKESKERNIIPALVSIASIQIALVDVLNEVGISPDGIVGHSTGELGCAYADGSLTAEETMLAAYWRGKALEDSNLGIGAMAALGITWSEAKKCCPKGIFPSCHNAQDSVTISGPKDSVKVFVEILKAENVFAREVDSCDYAFHSQYIFPAAGKLQAELEKIIPDPKLRTSRWISSSYPKEEWDKPSAKLAGASYFVHNLISPVLFHEALHHVPKDAIVIEIAPHHLLQAILKRVIGPDAEYIGLMKRNADNTVQLLSSLGRLYTAGLNPDIEKLYPQVQFPVPKSTPMISPLIKWDHSETWRVAKWDKNTNKYLMITEVNVSSDESPDKYILDHCIDGRCLYPASGYLVLVWKALAEFKGKDVASFPVKFEEVKIHRATLLSKTASTKFLVITNAGGEFEISEGSKTVCTGRIYPYKESVKNHESELLKSNDLESLPLNQNDIYKELKLRGYEYGPTFQGLARSDFEGNKGLLKWTGEWVVFLDSMLHLTILSSPKRALNLPTGIQYVKINPSFHKTVLDSALNEYSGVPVFHDKNAKRIISGGVELKNLKVSFASRNQGKQIPILEEYCFIPYNETRILSMTDEDTIGKYIHVCSSVAKMISKLSGGNENQMYDVIKEFKEADELIASYLKSNADNHVLLKSLCGIMNNASKDLVPNVKRCVTNYLSERDNDLLSQTMLQENPLRTVVDVFIENAASRNLKIAEIAVTSLPLSTQISKFVQTVGDLNVNYLIAHSEPDLLEKRNLPSVNFELSSWDPKSPLTFKNIDLCVMKFLNHPFKDHRRILENALATLKDNGFLLSVQRTRLIPAEIMLSAVGETVFPIYTESELEQTFKDLNLQVICKRSDSLTSTMYLLRKCADIPYEDIVIPIIKYKYEEWVDEMREQIIVASASSEPKRIWLVSEESYNSGIIGLVNCLRKEPGGSSIRCAFISKETPKLPEFNLKNHFYQDIAQKNLTMNVFTRGSWGSFRHLTLSKGHGKVETRHAYLNILTRGDLSSFVWIDSPLKYFKQSAEGILCQVYYAPLNFRDVMLASGKLPPDALPGNLVLQDSILGLEFSGRLENGQRIMGLVAAKGLATTVAADPSLMWEVPDEWSLKEASTVPAAYSTAYYALIMRGHLEKGERVLIHSGSGGVGQAAIAIALSLGCEVFTTVGSAEKREFLKKRYRELQDRNFCNSRDISFEQYILNATNGKGVDVVLNSLAEEKLKATLNCLAQHGRFLEIGKFDLSNNTSLGMAIFLKNISFHGILLDTLFENDSYSLKAKKKIRQLLKDGIATGTVKPLNSILYEHDEAEQAFRFMASGKHIGKVVLKIKDEEPEKNIAPTPVQFKALSRAICNPEKSYVIIGGLGGFGLELCQWLVERGARHVVLTSRSGLKTGYQKLCMNRWKKENINITISKLDATKVDETKALLKMAAEINPVAAIFNLALVLRDALMENQTVEKFKEVCESKVTSTLNLDAASQELCPELEWFVCFSSVSCGRGNAGQTNYGYANSVMERICEERAKAGLPSLAIQWGTIGDVGCVQDTVGSDVVIGGTVSQRINSCLTTLDKFLQQNKPVVSSFVPFQPSEISPQKASKHNVLSTVGKIFGIKDMSAINPEISLGELGIDSLMSVEVNQFLERNFDMVLGIHELRQLKVKDLIKLEGGDEEAKTARNLESKTTPTSESTFLSNVKISEHALGYLSSLSSKQLVPSETIIRMNSVKTGLPLFIVHPIEGTVAMFNSLAQMINSPVYGIQCTREAPSESIEQLAAWYWKHIKILNISNTINLAGYSFGGSVAFEMCLQAERDPQQHAKVQYLIMLDTSPAVMLASIQEHKSCFPNDSTAEEETLALCLYVLQFVHINVMEFKKELVCLPSLADRVKKAVKKISTNYSNLQSEDLTLAFDLYYKKLLMSLKYEPRHKLEKEVTLIKASDSVVKTKDISETFDLEKVCDGKITMHAVKGTHNNFFQKEGLKEVSALLNDIFSR